MTLIQGSPEIDFLFEYLRPAGDIVLDTMEVRAVLGPEIPLNTPDVLMWIQSNLEG